MCSLNLIWMHSVFELWYAVIVHKLNWHGIPSDYFILIESIVPIFSYILSNMTDNSEWGVKNQNKQTNNYTLLLYISFNKLDLLHI